MLRDGSPWGRSRHDLLDITRTALPRFNVSRFGGVRFSDRCRTVLSFNVSRFGVSRFGDLCAGVLRVAALRLAALRLAALGLAAPWLAVSVLGAACLDTARNNRPSACAQVPE